MHDELVLLRPGVLNDLAAPPLPDALCRDHHELFDRTAERPNRADVIDALAQALAICARCPELHACRAWLESLPANRRPYGVVAGVPSARRPPGNKAARRAG